MQNRATKMAKTAEVVAEKPLLVCVKEVAELGVRNVNLVLRTEGASPVVTEESHAAVCATATPRKCWRSCSVF